MQYSLPPNVSTHTVLQGPCYTVLAGERPVQGINPGGWGISSSRVGANDKTARLNLGRSGTGRLVPWAQTESVWRRPAGPSLRRGLVLVGGARCPYNTGCLSVCPQPATADSSTTECTDCQGHRWVERERERERENERGRERKRGGGD